jgi:RNA polymerase sigma-70 factor (ECF subfamily)
MRSEFQTEIVACIPALRRYARGLLHDRELADDLVQDTLERAWGRLGLFRRGSEMRPWLFSIMHNLFVDRMRRPGVSRELSSGDDLPEVADRGSPADRLHVRDLDRALQRLSPEQREVLLLVGVEELGYQEAADVLGIPIGTVMSRLSRARERLRAELEGRSTPARLQRVK